jgi:transposase
MESGAGPTGYVAERWDHLGIVAGVCREIGLAEWLDTQDTQYQERVSVGTVAMIVNGLGFSHRRLYLAPQFFATKAGERLLGPGTRPGITAGDLNDACFGRTLDWLYAPDPTTLFARSDNAVCRHRAARGGRLASRHARCMWTPPRSL